jgi:ABC-type transporter Mla subunit MlaD
MAPDDLSSRLDQLFQARTSDDAPRPALARPASPSAVDPAGPPLDLLEPLRELHVQLDHLHDQLEAAFAEVDGRFTGIDRQLAQIDGVRPASDATSSDTESSLRRIEGRLAASEHLSSEDRSDWQALLAQLRRVVAELADPPPVDLGPALQRLDQLELQLPGPPDLNPIMELIDKRVDAVGRVVSDVAADLRERLDHLEHGVRTVLPAEAPPDAAAMRAAVNAGALALAADIAKVNAEVGRLGRVVELQSKDMADISATLGLLKDRFLNH